MIGTCGAAARTALDSAMAGGSCGPPMTLTPRASTSPEDTARTALAMKSRSTLPSSRRFG